MTTIRQAPHLTDNWRCSDCNTNSITLDSGQMRICPKCFALLWHNYNSKEATELRRKRELELQQAAAVRERNRQKREQMDAARNIADEPPR